MNHQIIYQLYYAFVHRGFSALRFNFRGVGRSQGSFDHGTGELSDAAAALDWAQTINPERRAAGSRLLVRRLDRHAVADAPAGNRGFISICPPAISTTSRPGTLPVVRADHHATGRWCQPRTSPRWSTSSRRKRHRDRAEDRSGANHFSTARSSPAHSIGLSRQAAEDRTQAERRDQSRSAGARYSASAMRTRAPFRSSAARC